MLTQRQLFLRHNAQTTDFPLMIEIEKAEGLYMYSPDGKRYMDLISGIGVSSIGHRHPRVVAAVKDQLDHYMHLMVYGEYVQTPQVKFAEKLAAVLPDNLSSVYFVNSGAEAVEGAMKLAKRYTGRSEIISCIHSYHGSTQGALSLMGNEEFKNAYRPLLPGVRQVRFGSVEDLQLITTQTAAIVIETIQGEAGIQTATPLYWKALQARCRETGTLLVLDEIQCGFGRTGTLFAFEHYGIVPDILLLAKAMGGGMPIGAFISSAEIMASLKENPILGHITTFGGHPVCCAAGLANLEVLLEEKMHHTVAAKEQLFRSLLVHPEIREIRGKGLMLAIGLKDFDFNKKVIDECIAQGIIVDWFLHNSNSMRIAPPLIITEQEIREACQVILSAIDQVQGNS
jgi:acetylornithine/N-succinyldiaminopimelate aminotransferase